MDYVITVELLDADQEQRDAIFEAVADAVYDRTQDASVSGSPKDDLVDWRGAAQELQDIFMGARKSRTWVTSKLAGHWAGRIIGRALRGGA